MSQSTRVHRHSPLITCFGVHAVHSLGSARSASGGAALPLPPTHALPPRPPSEARWRSCGSLRVPSPLRSDQLPPACCHRRLYRRGVAESTRRGRFLVTCGRAGGRRTRWRATTWATRARPAFPLLFGSPHRRLQLRLVLYSSLPSRRPLAGSSPLYPAISRSASAPLLAPSPGPHLFLCGHASMYGGGGARTLAIWW